MAKETFERTKTHLPMGFKRSGNTFEIRTTIPNDYLWAVQKANSLESGVASDRPHVEPPVATTEIAFSNTLAADQFQDWLIDLGAQGE